VEPVIPDSELEIGRFWVYVIQGQPFVDRRGRQRPGRYYVGLTVSPARRLRQHNAEIVGGARATRSGRPWIPRALYGPYENRSEATKAERALKKAKRGAGRKCWLVEDSPLCRGEGANHPWVTDPLWRPQPSNSYTVTSSPSSTSSSRISCSITRQSPPANPAPNLGQ